MTPTELVALIAGTADKLRASGVRRLEFDPTGRCVVELAPIDPEPIRRGPVTEHEEPFDPFEDPATFGRRDGRVPGFTQLQQRRDDHEHD